MAASRPPARFLTPSWPRTAGSAAPAEGESSDCKDKRGFSSLLSLQSFGSLTHPLSGLLFPRRQHIVVEQQRQADEQRDQPDPPGPARRQEPEHRAQTNADPGYDHAGQPSPFAALPLIVAVLLAHHLDHLLGLPARGVGELLQDLAAVEGFALPPALLGPHGQRDEGEEADHDHGRDRCPDDVLIEHHGVVSFSASSPHGTRPSLRRLRFSQVPMKMQASATNLRGPASYPQRMAWKKTSISSPCGACWPETPRDSRGSCAGGRVR